MLSISHAATGAVIATNIPNPVISIPLILLSHYAFDAVHHWDMGTGLSSGKRTRQQAFFWGSLDLLLAGILVLLIYPSSLQTLLANPTSAPLHPALYGAFIGLLPDFLEAPRNFLKYEPFWLAPFNRFHHSFHHSIPRIVDGLAPQLILLIILVLFH